VHQPPLSWPASPPPTLTPLATLSQREPFCRPTRDALVTLIVVLLWLG
jgi:hypothetical protein